MSYNKKQFMHLLAEYKALAKKNNEALKTFTESKDYTDDAKKKAREVSKNQLSQYKEQYEKLLNGILDMAISNVTNKITERASDKDYQQALSNAFRMVELAGADMDPREMQALIRPFANDEIAIKAFRGVLSKQSPDSHEISNLLPSGTDARTIKMLDKMKTNVGKALDPEGQENPFGGDSHQIREMYLEGIEDFIGNKTSDNFECLE